MSERQTFPRVAVTDWLFPTSRRKKCSSECIDVVFLPVSFTRYTVGLHEGRHHIYSFITRVLSCTVSLCCLFTIGQPGGCKQVEVWDFLHVQEPQSWSRTCASNCSKMPRKKGESILTPAELISSTYVDAVTTDSKYDRAEYVHLNRTQWRL